MTAPADSRISDERLEELIERASINASYYVSNSVRRRNHDDTKRALTELRERRAQAVAVAWPGQHFCEVAERNATQLADSLKRKEDKQVALDAALAIRTLLASLAPPAQAAGVTITDEMVERGADCIPGGSTFDREDRLEISRAVIEAALAEPKP